MPKQISQAELDVILRVVSLFPQGASLEEIIKNLKTSLSLRTLQRRLTLLVKKGFLQIEGHTRARRYHISKAKTSVVKERPKVLLLSPKAKDLQEMVCQPLSMRTYVSYNREFLDQYRPNVTNYLSKETCQHLWALGQASSGERLAGSYAKQILSRLLIDLSWNSSRLEGNTYSLLETKRLLELGEVAEGKNALEAQMILNHKSAIDFLLESAGDLTINRYTILNLHALLSNNLLFDPRECGSLRLKAVGIEKSVYQPLAIPNLISECFQEIIDKVNAIKNPFEQAFFLMVHLPYLQPFEDVNKRVSRLAANLPLIRENLCPLSFVDVPQDVYIDGLLAIYEFNRIELLQEVFIWAYERSASLYSATRKSLVEPDPFRLRYRDLILETVVKVVHQCMDKKRAQVAIKKGALEKVPNEERAHFIEVIERELESLHEGNIARYRLSPSEYVLWRKNWL